MTGPNGSEPLDFLRRPTANIFHIFEKLALNPLNRQPILCTCQYSKSEKTPNKKFGFAGKFLSTCQFYLLIFSRPSLLFSVCHEIITMLLCISQCCCCPCFGRLCAEDDPTGTHHCRITGL